MQSLHARVVLDGLAYPEGIRWRDGKLWFSDVLDSKVYVWDPDAKRASIVAQLDDKPSGLGFLPDGTLLIVSMGELRLLRLDGNRLNVAADMKSICGDDHHLNDMVVDGRGRAYIGAYHNSDHSKREGKIVLVEPDGRQRIAADDLAAPNGMAITADGKTLLACDSADKRIVAFDVADDGFLTNRRTFADLGDTVPDGICLDAAGAVWVGLPFKGEFRRILAGGESTHRIVCEDRLAVAPALGGHDRRTLYLCTSRKLPRSELRSFMRAPSRLTEMLQTCQGSIDSSGEVAIAGSGWP